MPHPLETKIRAVRRRVRRLLLLYGISRLAIVLLVVVGSWCLADYLIHIEDRGLRILGWLVAASAAGWAGWRYVGAAWRATLRDLDIALRVERRFPELRDRLASTIQFLKQREQDPLAGSASLRRAVVTETVAAVGRLDLTEVLQPRASYRAAAWALAVAATVLALAAFDPRAASLALARLSNPWSDAAWPKANHLKFKNPPQRLALGQAFEVELVDAEGAVLPEEVRIHFLYDAEGPQRVEAVEPMRFAGGAMVARKESVSRPFAYRATGGDDESMPWIELEVVEPPAVEQLTATLTYPEYTGWPAETSERHIRALVGTRVDFSARTSKPLGAARLHIEGGAVLEGRLAPDRYGFTLPTAGAAPWIVEKSGAYWFELQDPEGFAGGQQVRYEIRAVEDLPPAINVDEPAGNSFVTADAVVPLRLSAKDDLALRRISLVYSRTDQSEQAETSLAMFEGPARAEPSAGKRAEAAGDARTVEHRWDLGPLKLKPGVQIALYATAEDYKPLTGQSATRRLTIITPDELQDRLAERQNYILNELARLLKLQREGRSQVSNVEIQLGQVGKLGKQDVDHLHGAELTQRQVDRGLTSATEGVPTQIAGLLADLANNKVDSPEIERRMHDLQIEIDRLAAEKLPAIGRHLTGALKGAQASASPGEPAEQPLQEATAESLAAAGKNQDDVIQSLETVLGELSQWDNYRRFHREVGQLRREQEDVNRETADVGRQTMTKEFKDLDPQQQANLKKIAGRQLELARRFDKIQERMQRMQGELDQADPLSAGAISDALEQSREQAVAEQMRRAGSQVQDNQVGQAAAAQKQVAEDLQDMLDILANRRENELARLVKKLREAEGKLDDLRGRQAGLRKKFEEAAKKKDETERRRELERLTREQQAVQEETQRLARALKRLQADRAGRSAEKGGANMGQAGEQAGQDQAQEAAGQAAAAEKDLDEAQEQLAQQRKKAEADLAAEQLARLKDGLESMRQRQAALSEETRHYDEVRQAQGELTRPQTISVNDLARQQQGLADETLSQAEKLAGAPAFQVGLKGAARDMSSATSQLETREVGAAAQYPQARALARLVQLIAALADDPGEAAKPDGGQEGQEGQQGGQSPGQSADGVQSLSELKLVKLMQEDVNARTLALQQARQSGEPLSPGQQQEYVDLSEEQGELADLLANLTATADNEEDDLEKLPESDDAPEDGASPEFDPAEEPDGGSSEARTAPNEDGESP